jgi:hypothetical protein
VPSFWFFTFLWHSSPWILCVYIIIFNGFVFQNKFNQFRNFNSNCIMQIYSILSFKWNLIFIKSTHFFMNSLLVVVLSSVCGGQMVFFLKKIISINFVCLSHFLQWVLFFFGQRKFKWSSDGIMGHLRFNGQWRYIVCWIRS